MHLHSYKMQLYRILKPADYGKRRKFVESIQKRERDDEGFNFNRILNMHNFCIWKSENLRVFKEK